MRTKTSFIGLKVSEKEKAQLMREAEKKRLGLSAWVRFLLFDNRIATKIPR
jgi:hypothetical protein